MNYWKPPATSTHAVLVGQGPASWPTSTAAMITASDLSNLCTHWAALSSLVHSRQRPNASQHAQALLALRSHPSARLKFLAALRNKLLRDFAESGKEDLAILLSRSTGVERLIKGLFALQDYQSAWLDALDAPDDIRREFAVGFQAQVVGMLDPGLEKYLARYVLVTAGGTYAVPISDADANAVRDELGLPLLDAARHGVLPRSTNPNASLSLLHTLNIFPLALASLLTEAKEHIHSLIATSSTATSLLSAPLTEYILEAIHTSIFPRLAYCLCPTHLPPTALYRDLLYTAAHEILRVRGKHMSRVIPAGVDLCAGAVDDVRMCTRIGHKVTRRLVVDPTAAWMREKVFVASKPTHDILRVFISAIQVFRAIEAGTVANAGGQPLFHDLVEEMKVYLRGRDAVRDLVALVFPMDGAGGAVAEEALLEGAEIRMEEEESRYLVVVDEAMSPWAAEDEAGGEWVDKPRVPAAASIPQGIPRDTLSILMNIYPAKDVFATHYAARLADLLLFDRDTDLSNLWRVVTRLARRISVKDMGACLAMVRDAIESRDVNAAVRHPTLHPLVISSEVWPDEWSRSGQDEDEWQQAAQRLHPELKRLADDFTSQFTSRSPLHTLTMYPTSGTVTLSLEFDTDLLPPLVVECTPDHASLLMHMSNGDEWTRDALVAAMHLSLNQVRALVSFWLRRGLVEPVPNRTGVYRAVSERPEAHTWTWSLVGGRAVDDWSTVDTSFGDAGAHAGGDQALAGVGGSGVGNVFEGIAPGLAENWAGYAKAAVRRADNVKDILASMCRYILYEASRPTIAQTVATLDKLVADGLVDKVEDARVEGGFRYLWREPEPGAS